jgi:hypothetical protein
MIVLDAFIVASGLAACLGTIFNWGPFDVERQSETWVEMFGRRRTKIILAAVYLGFALLGALMLLRDL